MSVDKFIGQRFGAEAQVEVSGFQKEATHAHLYQQVVDFVKENCETP